MSTEVVIEQVVIEPVEVQPVEVQPVEVQPVEVQQVATEQKSRKPRSRDNSNATSRKPRNAEQQRKPYVFEQTRKALPYDMLAKSNAVLDYLKRNGGRAVGAFQRIAALSQLVQNNSNIRNRLTEWLNCRLAISQEDVVAFESLVTALKTDVIIDPLRIVIPETFTYQIDVTHPVFWRFIGLIEAVDRNIAEIENMWIAGLIDDESMMKSVNSALDIIGDLVKDVYQITAASRTHRNGLYSVNDFKLIMAALSSKSIAEK